MESVYDLFGDVRALYSSSGNYRMCSLARMCQTLITAIEEETNEFNKYPEIYSLVLKYIIEMYQILHKEKNNKVRKMGYDILSKLSRIIL